MDMNNHFLSVKPSPTLAVSAKAAALRREGFSIINLSVGEPDFDTPDNIKDAAIKAIRDGKTKYTAVDGIIELRQAIAEKFLRENELSYAPDQIIVSTGGKQSIFNAMLVTLNPGDEVIVPAPYWVSYVDMVTLTGAKPVVVTCGLNTQFKLTPQALEQAITSRTKWLFLNSPSNPTGMVYTRAELSALAEVLRRHPHVWVLSDDIYEHLLFDNLTFCNIANVAPDLMGRILIVNGVSKAYAMTGWRIGYAAGPKSLVQAMGSLQSHSTSNPCSIAQYAALEAISGNQDSVHEGSRLFEERRNLAFDLFTAIPGLVTLKPQGAFYLYITTDSFMSKVLPNKEKITSDAILADYLLTQGVAVVHGSAFGFSPAFRISYALSKTDLTDAATKIKIALSVL